MNNAKGSEDNVFGSKQMNNTTGVVVDNGLEVLPPETYEALCITNLVLCITAVILAAIVIVAMTLPLFYPKSRKKYSTYNLYLAYMSIPDLVANGLVVYLLLIDNRFNQWMGGAERESTKYMFELPFDHSLMAFCMSGSMYINAFLTYEVYQLLRDSNNLRRHNPPTISRVSTQAMISYGIGICFFLVDYWVFVKNGVEGEQWMILYQVSTAFILGVVPLLVLVVICIMIYKQKLIRSTKSMYEGRLKVLFVYFARIIFVSLLHWFPAGLAYLVSWVQKETNSTKIIAYSTALIFGASQVIVSFGFTLTKPDACALILNLLNCAYCLECCKSVKGTTEDNSYFDDPYLRANLSTGRLFMTGSSSNSRNNQEKNGVTVVSEQAPSNCHEKQNTDWKDEEAGSEHPRTIYNFQSARNYQETNRASVTFEQDQSNSYQNQASDWKDERSISGHTGSSTRNYVSGEI